MRAFAAIWDLMGLDPYKMVRIRDEHGATTITMQNVDVFPLVRVATLRWLDELKYISSAAAVGGAITAMLYIPFAENICRKAKARTNERGAEIVPANELRYQLIVDNHAPS
ncbi:MAG: hypothetical protein SNJ79_12815 [Sphingomonadaceae bacterium]